MKESNELVRNAEEIGFEQMTNVLKRGDSLTQLNHFLKDNKCLTEGEPLFLRSSDLI